MSDIFHLIASSKPGVQRDELKQAEEALAVTLPEQYNQMFLQTNQAEFGDWTLFPIKTNSNLKKTWDDLVRQNQSERNDHWPDHFCAIGEDGLGNYIGFVSQGAELAPAVYYWDHEELELRQEAPTLFEFIRSVSEDYE
ncbi:cell wall assembly regulator SMI1 [Alkalihalobacillus xiaoxiensis]|uniref:Cell wall assembly regulator SMI1 n=1 Tax=Shouchella xiaoxiensis TaxID=766895 RepID=A0ABS2SPA9_9BACI|nr:SMI1/KNR4 family protein [Shouchella xiaoxiensis]MBM7837367.1 cell wall assembly regulator SMI1 [Shouchella xiaoxiensis]